MKILSISAAVCSAFALASSAKASQDIPAASAPSGPAIRTEDVAAFYAIYDSAKGHPTAEALQRYIDEGSPGLRRLAQLRNVTGARIAAKIEEQPQIYKDAKRCMAVLPQVRRRSAAALQKLVRLYPEAKFQPVTIAVGRGKPVGVTDDSGVMIGLEALCGVTWLEPNLEDRFVHVIAHEYAHVQQAFASPALFDKKKPTVLEAALIEGGAEFVAELTSGGISYSYLRTLTKGHEAEIEQAFLRDKDKTDLSAWFYNGTLSKPGDLGYWVGYRITKSYYEHAADKRQALRDILGVKNPDEFLARSGWSPGMKGL
jgi:hypothetical protein